MRIAQVTFEIEQDNGGLLEVSCNITPEDPGCWTLPNGDPGYPGSPAEVEITSIKRGGEEIPDAEFDALCADEKWRGYVEDCALEKIAEIDEPDPPERDID